MLREQLHALVGKRPGDDVPENVLVWIEFSWDTDARKRALQYVRVSLSGAELYDKFLDFTVHTTHGWFGRRNLRIEVP